MPNSIISFRFIIREILSPVPFYDSERSEESALIPLALDVRGSGESESWCHAGVQRSISGWGGHKLSFPFTSGNPGYNTILRLLILISLVENGDFIEIDVPGLR